MAVFEHEDGTIAYHVDGPRQAASVVFSHGGLLDHRSWAPQLEALSADHLVVAWDLPGHGHSGPPRHASTARSAEALVALMNHLAIDRATLVGHSVGGWVAQEAAYRHPDRATAVVCIGTTPLTLSKLPRPAEWLFRRSAAIMRPWPFPLVRWLVGLVFAREAATRAYVRDAAARIEKHDFLDFWRGASQGLRYEPGYAYPVPLLIAHGQNDLIGAVRLLSKRWRAACPDAEYAVIPDAGHCANLDNPTFTNDLLRDFLRRVEGDRLGPSHG